MGKSFSRAQIAPQFSRVTFPETQYPWLPVSEQLNSQALPLALTEVKRKDVEPTQH